MNLMIWVLNVSTYDPPDLNFYNSMTEKYFLSSNLSTNTYYRGVYIG